MHDLPRRPILLAPLLAMPFIRRATAAIPGIPPNRRLAFDVLRNGSKIGTHILDFSRQGDRLLVAIDIRIAAGIGPLTLYRYEMTGTETWQNDQFLALDTTTDDDGTHHVVTIRRDDGGLRVRSTHFPDTTLAADTVPLTHWNEATLALPLLSPQDGQVMHAIVSPAGSRLITLANGQTVTASGYNVKAKTPVQDWYDPTKTWIGLHADAKDGSDIDYRRQV